MEGPKGPKGPPAASKWFMGGIGGGATESFMCPPPAGPGPKPASPGRKGPWCVLPS